METTIGSDSKKVYENIFPAEAWELISKSRSNNKLVILDVSTPNEFKDLHLEGAINASLLSRFFKARLDIMDKGKTYIVYCKVGARSRAATKLMKMLGFQTVYNITGGTLLWEEEGLPFASGTSGVNKLSLCPFLIFTMLLRKVSKGFNKIFHRPVGSLKNTESLS